MREFLIAHGVLCFLMATTFAAIGLLSLWATICSWSWYVRAAVVIAALSWTLLRPAPDLFVTLATQVIAVVAGVAAYRGRSAVWVTLRGKQKFAWPRIDLRSLLAAMGLTGISVAMLKVALTAGQVETYRDPVVLGLTAGATTLLAAWWNVPERTWKGRFLALILLFPIAGALHYSNFFFNAAPVITFWPYSFENWYGPFPQLVASLCSLGFATAFVLLQVAFVALWRGAWENLVWNGLYQMTRLMATILLTVLLVALPAYVLARLQFPAPIPQQLTFAGDQEAFNQLLDLADQFKKTQLWREICKDPIDNELLAVAVNQESIRYQKLHSLLKQPVRRPLSIEWMFDVSDPRWYAAQRAHSDDTQRLGTLFYVLDAQGDTARRERDASTSIQSGLALIQLADTTFRGVEFSDYLRADNYSQSGMKQIYGVLTAMDEAQCEHCTQQIEEVLRRKPPIEILLGYERAASENGYGWTGHLVRILGDLVNRIDLSLDANYTEFLRRIDVRSRATAQLLLVELSLRKYFVSNGSYPPDLHDLASMDRSGLLDWDQIVYQLRKDGYLLYHFGTDGDDDAGRPSAPNSYGAPDNTRGDGDLELRTHFADDPFPSENDS